MSDFEAANEDHLDLLLGFDDHAFENLPYAAVQERFLVLTKVGQEFDHVLQVAFGLDGVVDVVAAALELVSAGGVLDNLSLLHAFHEAVIDAERYAAAVSKLGQDGLFLSGGGIFSDNPYRSVTVANNIVVGQEFHGAGQYHIEEVLRPNFLHLCRRQHFRFSKHLRFPPLQ